jgi:hypothetical protein
MRRRPPDLAVYTEGPTVSIFKTTTTWQGASGLPGYTNLFFNNDGTDVATQLPAIKDAVHDFWSGLAGVIPTGVSLTTSAEVGQIAQATGTLETIWAFSPSPDVVNGGGSGVGPAPAGACISWQTGEVHDGRQVRGRTFIVPLALNVYQSDGTLTGGAVTDINAAAVALIGAIPNGFCIWARPKTGVPGEAYSAVTGVAKDKVAVLRSRRD